MPLLPAPSVTLTVNVWLPSARAEVGLGRAAVAGDEEAAVELAGGRGDRGAGPGVTGEGEVGAGGARRVVRAGVDRDRRVASVSIVQVKLAVPLLPAPSVTLTVNVWLPSARAEVGLGRAAVAGDEEAAVELAGGRGDRGAGPGVTGEGEVGAGGARRVVRAGVDRDRRVAGVDRPGVAGGAAVAGAVGHLDGERVAAVGEGRGRPGPSCCRRRRRGRRRAGRWSRRSRCRSRRHR